MKKSMLTIALSAFSLLISAQDIPAPFGFKFGTYYKEIMTKFRENHLGVLNRELTDNDVLVYDEVDFGGYKRCLVHFLLSEDSLYECVVGIVPQEDRIDDLINTFVDINEKLVIKYPESRFIYKENKERASLSGFKSGKQFLTSTFLFDKGGEAVASIVVKTYKDLSVMIRYQSEHHKLKSNLAKTRKALENM